MCATKYNHSAKSNKSEAMASKGRADFTSGLVIVIFGLIKVAQVFSMPFSLSMITASSMIYRVSLLGQWFRYRLLPIEMEWTYNFTIKKRIHCN